MYDRDEAGEFDAGRWIDLINEYNAVATPGNELGEVFSYGSDMETYCEDSMVENCTIDDLYSYYTTDSDGYLSTGAYDEGLEPVEGADGTLRDVLISPIIDGRIGPDGYLTNFDGLSEELARAYADKVTALYCGDERIDGIQFDLEPFDVSTKNGQYYFYLQIAENFAGANEELEPAVGCVDDAHPRGRFFSFFTFANAIEPGTQSASNVADIVAAGNGYMIASLYNLNNRGPGKLDGLPEYTETVRTEVENMKAWAGEAEIPYGFGIPASASSNEFTTCDGPDCAPDAAGETGYRMLDYTRAATEAMHAHQIDDDPLFRGVSIWDFGEGVNVDGNEFGPAPAPAEVMLYLSHNLIRPDSEQPGDGTADSDGADDTSGGSDGPDAEGAGADTAGAADSDATEAAADTSGGAETAGMDAASDSDGADGAAGAADGTDTTAAGGTEATPSSGAPDDEGGSLPVTGAGVGLALLLAAGLATAGLAVLGRCRSMEG